MEGKNVKRKVFTSGSTQEKRIGFWFKVLIYNSQRNSSVFEFENYILVINWFILF
jgi:hypothetical protein